MRKKLRNTQRRFSFRWQSRSGSVLILASWAVLFLGFFAVSMGFGVRQKLVMASRLSERAARRLAAEAGARRGIAELKKRDSDDTSDSFREPWAASEALFKDVRVGPALVSVGYETLDDGVGKIAFRYGILDEERKINLNTASLDVMKRLFKEALGMDEMEAQTLASCILDWRDADSMSQATGAEDNYYLGLKYPYECKDAPLSVFDELLLVRGITATIYQKLKDAATIYGDGAVNVNTATKGVFLALGLSERLTEKILAFRRGDDGQEATADDQIFTQKTSIGPQVSQGVPLDNQELAQLSNAVSGGFLDVVSRHFLIESRARYDGKKAEGVVSCIFRRGALENGVYDGHILYWRTENS